MVPNKLECHSLQTLLLMVFSISLARGAHKVHHVTLSLLTNTKSAEIGFCECVTGT